MRVFTVVVGHREAMLAEGVAAALAGCPGIVPIGSVTTAGELFRVGERADAVAIDARLPGARRVASRLRHRGVHVVFLGEGGEERGMAQVSTQARLTSLASALDPWSGAATSAPPPLTIREREVLSLVSQGLVAKQVARQLGISHKTVERHKTRIFSKLGVPNAAAAVRHFATIGREGDAA